MTAYATLLTDPSSPRSEHLYVIEPRIRASGFAVFSGAIYRTGFSLDDFGEVRSLEVDGVAYTRATSSALNSGEFYHDIDNDFLYLRMIGDLDPEAAPSFVVAGYELYVGTVSAQTGRDPLDDTSRRVYYHPIVEKSSSRKDSISDSLFGYSPDQRSAVSLLNGERLFENKISQSSFNLAPIKVYHWLGKDNLGESRKLIISGYCKNVNYTDEGDSVSFEIFDQRNLFSEEFRNVGGVSFLNSTDFPNLDSQHSGSALRKAFGVVDGARGYNIDFSDTPGSGVNRTWLAASGHTNLCTIQRTVAGAPASTTTRTYLDNANGLRVGDTFENQGLSESSIITAVNRTSAPFYIEHTTIPFSIAPTGGQIIERGAVASATIVQDGVAYVALYGRDYSIATYPTESAFGITFVGTLQANLGLPNELSSFDDVYFRIYGQTNTTTLGGPAFGSDDPETSNLTQGVVILLELLKSYAGIPESSIDAASFTALQGSNTDALGFAIPFTSSDDMPQIKDIITNILKSLLIKLYLNKNAQWEIRQTGPFSGAADFTIDDSEILEGSFSYTFVYDERVYSRFTVKYAHREVHENPRIFNPQTKTALAESDIAKYLHKINRGKTFDDILLFKETEAQTLVNRLRSAFGDRRGEVSFQVKENRFFDAVIGDRIDITKVRIPSPSFDNETVITQSIIIEDTDQSLPQQSISGSDQKGIENASPW